MKNIIIILVLFCNIALSKPTVVSSIYPLQQIANAITGEQTKLIARTFLSPHNYKLKPSDAKLTQEADLLIWISESMMPQLNKYIAERNKITIEASKIQGINLITDTHAHNHNHSDSHSGEEESNKNDDKVQVTEGYNYNPHIWLSTDNAKLIAQSITKKLIEIDAENENKYKTNLDKFVSDIDITKSEIRKLIKAVQSKPYFVFHEAYQYFEEEFGLQNKGAIKLDSNKSITTKKIYNLKKLIEKYPNSCLFKEPQFDDRIIKQIISTQKIGTLDPVGYSKDKNKNYNDILLGIANGLNDCFN